MKMPIKNKSELCLIVFRRLLKLNIIIQRPKSPNSHNNFDISDFGVISKSLYKTFTIEL